MGLFDFLKGGKTEEKAPPKEAPAKPKEKPPRSRAHRGVPSGGTDAAPPRHRDSEWRTAEDAAA